MSSLSCVRDNVQSTAAASWVVRLAVHGLGLEAILPIVVYTFGSPDFVRTTKSSLYLSTLTY